MIEGSMPHFSECFGIEKPEDCVAPCVLEYRADAEDEDPICVPSVDVLNSFPPDGQRAVNLVKNIVRRLLPKEDSEAFTEAFNKLHIPLYEYMDMKLIQEIRSINHATWQESCKKIATRIMNEINNTECDICRDNLNDNNDRGTLAISKCCSNILHLDCLLDNAERRGRVCPWCAEPMLQIKPGNGQQFPDPAPEHGVSVYKAVLHALSFISCLLLYGYLFRIATRKV